MMLYLRCMSLTLFGTWSCTTWSLPRQTPGHTRQHSVRSAKVTCKKTEQWRHTYTIPISDCEYVIHVTLSTFYTSKNTETTLVFIILQHDASRHDVISLSSPCLAYRLTVVRFVPKFSRLLLGKTSPTGDRCGPARYTAQKKYVQSTSQYIHTSCLYHSIITSKWICWDNKTMLLQMYWVLSSRIY